MATTTNYIWDDDAVLMETDETGATTATYTREPDQFGSLISQRRGGQTHVHHYDALGSTTELTDSTETVSDTFRYAAFGTQVQRNGTTQTPYTWVGRSGYQRDEPKRFYVRRRHYSENRWLSHDPAGRVTMHSGIELFKLLIGPYLYSSNQPTLRIDPSGLKDAACCCWRTMPMSFIQHRIPNFRINTAQFVADANDIWAQCCIRIKTVLDGPKVDHSDLWATSSGVVTVLEPGVTVGGERTPHSDIMNMTRNQDSRSVNVYVFEAIQSFEGTPPRPMRRNGRAFPFICPPPVTPYSSPPANAIMLRRRTSGRTLAHELGHILGLPHASGLMVTNENAAVKELDEMQCSSAQSNFDALYFQFDFFFHTQEVPCM